VLGQVRAPDTPAPNYNRVAFPAVTARQLRVLVTRAANRAVGIKEIQVFDTRSQVQAPGGVGGTVPATLPLQLGSAASFGTFTPGVTKDYSAQTTANVVSTAGDATLSVSDPGHLSNGAFSLPAAVLYVKIDSRRRLRRCAATRSRSSSWSGSCSRSSSRSP
jgi:hypothetical protein